MDIVNTMYQPIKPYKPLMINKKEEIDINALNYLLINKCILDEYEDEKTKGKLHTILKKYKKGFNNGYIFTQYEQKNPNIGRYYVKGCGLAFLKKEIRETLCHKYHTDIDMVNAYPSILLNVCEKNKWNTPILKDYVENRDKKLKEIMDKTNYSFDDAKRTINVIINDGINDDVRLKDTWLQDLEQELYFVKEQIFNNYDQYKSIAMKKKKVYENRKGSTVALLLSDIENQCLLALDDYLSNNGYDVQVLVFDGLQISNKKEINDNILNEAEKFILDKIGIKIKLKIKPFTKYLNIDYSNNNQTDELIDDDYACKIFYNLIDNYIISCKSEIIVFDEDTGIWANDDRTLWRYVHKHKKNLVFKAMTMFGEKTYDYGGNHSNIKKMLKFLPNYCEIDDNFWNNYIDTSKGKLLFKNGYYDFHTNTFTKEFNPNIVFHTRINRNFNLNVPQKYIDKVHKSLFEDPFLEEEQKVMSKYMKISLARGMAGDYLYKVCYFLIGLKDSCKGVLYEALKSTFENYISTFNGACLYYNKINTDEAKKLSWLMDIAYSRITFASEPRIEKDVSIDTSLLKALSSGGDPHICRKNNKDEIELKNRATLMLLCNDCPSLKPADEAVVGRLNYIELKCRFLPEKEITNTRFQRLADDNIKIDFKQINELKDALMLILINAYQEFLKDGHHIPNEVLKAKDEWLDNEYTLKSILQKRFIFTSKYDDYVSVKNINEYLMPHRSKLLMSDKKISLELNNLTGFQYSGTTDIDRNKIRIRRGIKEIPDKECEDYDDF